jgi:hypothetical protein
MHAAAVRCVFMQLFPATNRTDAQKVTSFAMEYKFYQDLNTLTATPEDIIRVLKQSLHRSIIEGPAIHVKSMDKEDIANKMFHPKKRSTAFFFSQKEFLIHGVQYTRVGICGLQEVTNAETGDKKTVTRFHAAMSLRKLQTIVFGQRVAKGSLSSATNAQRSIKPVFADAVSQKLTSAQFSSDEYEIHLKLKHVAGSSPDSKAVSNDARFLGINMHECILYGHRGIQFKTAYVSGSIDVHLREEAVRGSMGVSLQEEADAKRQKLHPRGGTICKEPDAKRQKK